MGDGSEREGLEGSEVAADAPQPAEEENAGAVAEQGGPNATVDESLGADVSITASAGSLKDEGAKVGWSRKLFDNHKILLGVEAGVLAVLLIVGIFTIGYFVGKPDEKQQKRAPNQQLQSQEPIRPDQRSAPSPGRGGGGSERFGILGQYSDEIEGTIAEKLGISADDLRDEIENGNTIIEIAEEKGVSTEDLTASVAAKISEIIGELAADGEITAARAEEIKSDAEDIASRLIERGHLRAGMPPGL